MHFPNKRQALSLRRSCWYYPVFLPASHFHSRVHNQWNELNRTVPCFPEDPWRLSSPSYSKSSFTGVRFAFVSISGWPFKEAERLCSISTRKYELAWGWMAPGVIFTLRDERQIAELRSGDCFVAENVMLMLLDISSEEEARIEPFFMLLQSLWELISKQRKRRHLLPLRVGKTGWQVHGGSGILS